ncbi:phytase [Adhaeribacter pallidiroseus]|uniref:3-phytase n=1 Tax=Adhaeribacter pallidiroseus TaxID=2072847 RepID=A0A369QG14_9BACT|nr:phytase [Adhaeribacter pallidiroseus]RDC61839.1 3-phytase [Adhaeribacter pallidiroseus]
MKTCSASICIALIISLLSCKKQQSSQPEAKLQAGDKTVTTETVKPFLITDTVQFDTDDPAVWINPTDPAQSLVIGTDKEANGGLYVFNLTGKIIPEKTKKLQRPDNVDVEYGLRLNGKPTDIAVTTERLTHKLRIYALPDMQPLDNGGVEVFAGETGPEFRSLMGIALYKNKAGKIYAIVGRKSGPTNGTYLWQYLLEDDGQGQVKATLVRKLGQYSGKKEIEAIAVDDALGYVYYSDEGVGVRKYYADPEKGNQELALFATTGFTEDHEGISIYQLTDSTGYILVSDQQANQFHIFPREGSASNPHQHSLIKVIKVATKESDGSETVSVPLNAYFKHGLFIAMSADKTFQFYRWEDIAGKDLQKINVTE